MSANINLLLRTDEESLRQKKRTKILNFIAAVSLAGVCLISIGIFVSIKIINIESIRKERKDVLVKISRFQDQQSELFVLNNRAENIEKLLKVRKNLAKTMNGLMVKMPRQFIVENLEIDGKSVVISGQSMSLSTIGEFIDSLTDMARKKEIIKSLTLSSLTLSEGRNVYQITVKSEL